MAVAGYYTSSTSSTQGSGAYFGANERLLFMVSYGTEGPGYYCTKRQFGHYGFGAMFWNR